MEGQAGPNSRSMVEHAGGLKCPRCWKYKEDIGSSSELPEVCGACATAVTGES